MTDTPEARRVRAAELAARIFRDQPVAAAEGELERAERLRVANQRADEHDLVGRVTIPLPPTFDGRWLTMEQQMDDAATREALGLDDQPDRGAS